MVPQELVFDPFFNVREALRIQSGYFGVKNNDAWIDELLESLGLADKADANMRQLSGGMKRRVLVAQALVYIASSVVEPFIEPFAKRIGAQVSGTPVEIKNGRVQMVGELVASEKKLEQILGRLGVKRVDFAYGDTVLDIPLLEHAEHPVAVYPDAKLKSVAVERGWEIIGDTPKIG